MKNTTRLLVALVGLAGTANAQLTNFKSPEVNNVIGAWNTLTAPNTFHDVLSAQLDSGHDLDAVYRVDDGILVTTDIVLGGPAFGYSMTSISAMAVWPDGNGGNDILLAGPAGITVLDIGIDRVANFVTLAQADLNEPAVAGLLDLEYVPSSGPNGDYWIGLSSDKRTLVKIKQDSSTASGLAVDTTYSAACSADAWELEAIDFQGNGTSALAVLTEAGLALFTSVGSTPQLVYPLVATTGMVRAISTGTTNQIAWIRPLPNTEYEVAVVTITSLTTSQSLGTYVPVGAAAGDISGDGNVDLALTLADASQVLLLKNIAGSLDLTEHQILDTGLPASTNNVAQPLALNIDDDNNVDVLCADASQTSLVFFRSFPASPREPEISYFEHIDLTSGNLVMRSYGSHTPVDPEATHLLVSSSLQKMAGSIWETVETVFDDVLVELQRFRASAPFALATIQVNDPAVTGTSEYITHFTARLVRVVNGEVTRVWPPLFGVLADSTSLNAIAHIDATYPGVTILDTGNGEKAGKTDVPPEKLPPLKPTPTGP